MSVDEMSTGKIYREEISEYNMYTCHVASNSEKLKVYRMIYGSK
jgi:hypothetical protein